MASPSGDHSNFDMRQAEQSWATFNRIAVWVIIGCLIILSGMAFFLTGGHPPKPL